MGKIGHPFRHHATHLSEEVLSYNTLIDLVNNGKIY